MFCQYLEDSEARISIFVLYVEILMMLVENVSRKVLSTYAAVRNIKLPQFGPNFNGR